MIYDPELTALNDLGQPYNLAVARPRQIRDLLASGSQLEMLR